MGVYDSSLTRVAPLFNRLCNVDQSGESWLRELLEAPRRPDGHCLEIPSKTLKLAKRAWAPDELKLPAPTSLLIWLIDHPTHEPPALLGGAEAAHKRKLLLAGDGAVRTEALAKLAQKHIGSGWWIFEGQTSIDAYLETDDWIVVIAGKSTE